MTVGSRRPAVPMARFGISRPYDNVALGWSFIMESIGHELGHVYGLDHAPCGNPDDPDDDFTPSNGSIGDVGVDPAAMVAFPATTGDLMSYCGDKGSTAYEKQWISGVPLIKQRQGTSRRSSPRGEPTSAVAKR